MNFLKEMTLTQAAAAVGLVSLVAIGTKVYEYTQIHSLGDYIYDTLNNGAQRYGSQGYAALDKAAAVDGELFSPGITVIGTGATATVTTPYGAATLTGFTIDVANDAEVMQIDNISKTACLKLSERNISPYLYIGGTAAANKVRDPLVNQGHLDTNTMTTLCSAAPVSMYFARK